MDKRENWIDSIKVLACTLILVGHLVQGLQRTGILVRNGKFAFFLWFIYLFHVQLFFLCSGYLHEKKDKAGSLRDWLHYIGYKLVALGIPYFSFSLITWLLKSRFIDLVNIRTGHLIAFLFTSPALAQYWYLYTLFFLFLFIPNIKNNKILIPLAVGFFGLYLISGRLVFSFALYSMAQYGFWFVLGMLMCNLGFGDLKKSASLIFASLVLIIIFTGTSCALYSYGYRATFTIFTIILGTLACLGLSMLFRYIEACGFYSRFVTLIAKYSFPIYLLHTIYAASVRTLLIFTGVKSVWIHLLLGFTAGTAGSILTAFIFEKMVYPEFIFYPWKVIKRVIKNSRNN
jgi:fucose 4-O-acetylase-like acetyltransferase